MHHGPRLRTQHQGIGIYDVKRTQAKPPNKNVPERPRPTFGLSVQESAMDRAGHIEVREGNYVNASNATSKR